MTARRSVDDDAEEPSPDDVARLGHESAYCPHCSAEVWDDAQYCAACGSSFDSASPWPVSRRASRRLVTVLAVTLAAVGLLGFLWAAIL